ncbi:MAG: ATP-dependent helicase [Desulfovibrio sp.]|nr:ATP-dependent helicase [Desulfovibrio sp.]
MSIDFANELNSAQLEAIMHQGSPALVIAGAGSGKTRTIVYRLARLVQDGIPPENILLLTFTRKAAQEMLLRAGTILGRNLSGTSGGTFHSFAFGVLRRNARCLGFDTGFTLLDRADSENVVKEVKDSLALGKGDRSYPKKNTLLDMITKSRNKERGIDSIVENEAFHLSSYAEDFQSIADGYTTFKQRHALLDYDDLLFRFEELLLNEPSLLEELRTRYRHIMVDEYQDTNKVQARLVRRLSGECGDVVAVGDDAQSIYAFRGADVANILDFPKIFKDAKLIRLEKNYRSTQAILNLTNHILAGAQTKFDKHLYSDRQNGALPRVVHPLSDQTQAKQVVEEVIKLAKKYPLHEIAVLFRAGYQSYPLEVALSRVGIGYQKYGGLRFHEAAHIKDVLAYLRLLRNPADLVAWRRVLAPIKGVGPKTADRIANARLNGDEKYMAKTLKRFPDLKQLFNHLDSLSHATRPGQALEQIAAFYQPMLAELYPDDYPKRQAGLDQLSQIAINYSTIDDFLADLTLDGDQEEEVRKENALVLSTVHSSKGLEWKAVLIIDLVEDRFPSKRALARPEDLDEERRLLYVACTRAKDSLTLFVPATIYNRFNAVSEPATPSPFLAELPADCVEIWREGYASGLNKDRAQARNNDNSALESLNANITADDPSPSPTDPSRLGMCRHKIFGQGKIVAHIPPNKYRINFPGFGLKVIVADYLEML